MNELTVVRAAVYLCHAQGRKPNRRLVDSMIRCGQPKSIKGIRLDAFIKQVLAEA